MALATLPRARGAMSVTNKGGSTASHLRELQSVILPQSKAVTQLQRDVSYLREAQEMK